MKDYGGGVVTAVMSEMEFGHCMGGYVVHLRIGCFVLGIWVFIDYTSRVAGNCAQEL